MSSHRRCDAQCHDAKHEKCECWCGGLFHGAKGEAARQAFRDAFGDDVPPWDPRDEEQLHLFETPEGRRFAKAFEAAQRARR